MAVIGPASWNTIVQLPHLPEARPQMLFAADSWMTLGGTSAGKALHLADLGVPVTLSTVVGTDQEALLIREALSNPRIRLIFERSEGSSERHLNLMAGGARVSVYLSTPGKPDGDLPQATRAALQQAEHIVLDLSARSADAIPLLSSAACVWTDLHDCDGVSAFHRPFLEAADVVFMSNDAVGDPRSTMKRIIAMGKRFVVCTLGAAGAIALDDQG